MASKELLPETRDQHNKRIEEMIELMRDIFGEVYDVAPGHLKATVPGTNTTFAVNKLDAVDLKALLSLLQRGGAPPPTSKPRQGVLSSATMREYRSAFVYWVENLGLNMVRYASFAVLTRIHAHTTQSPAIDTEWERFLDTLEKQEAEDKRGNLSATNQQNKTLANSVFFYGTLDSWTFSALFDAEQQAINERVP